ncbi:retrotransposon-related protein [Tanacetum coccineum]
MRTNSLFAKKSKCVFAVDQVEYLGYVISAKGVSTDPSKIEAMKNWRHQPLSNLLKKNAFHWSTDAQIAFENLKEAMIQTPVLALPKFEAEFVVETDASGISLGAVLQQGGHPIAYLSKTLAPKHQSLFTYEKEFMAVVMALEKWRGYLLDMHFKIRTDHFSLKYFLDQRLSTPFQTKWLPKLLGFDYEISYKKGADNVAADALSRLSTSAELHSTILSVPNKKFTWENGELRRKDKLVIGIQVSLKKLSSLFYWKGMSKAVKMFVRECDICQRYKPNLEAYSGFLQPLPVPEQVWKDISMDFIDGLPSSQGKTVILVVVDRLSKYAHFLPLSHPYTATQVAQVFLDNVYKLHGLPQTIVSDRDRVFLSLFWKNLFKLLKTELHMSTAYHPQSDGQTEVVNMCLECYFRCMTGEKPKEWTHWISLAEYWYNTNFHTSINTTPFEIVYGQAPTFHIPYVLGTSNVDQVDRTLAAREDAFSMLKIHLRRAQDRMKAIADGHTTDR